MLDRLIGTLARTNRRNGILWAIDAVQAALSTACADFRRTHATEPMSFRLTSHRLASAHSVCTCAVFLASPR